MVPPVTAVYLPRRPGDHRGEAAQDAPTHVQPRVPVLAVAEQPDAFIAEGAHGGERAAEPDRQATAELRGDDRRSSREPHDEAEQQRAGDVDGQGACWE